MGCGKYKEPDLWVRLFVCLGGKGYRRTGVLIARVAALAGRCGVLDVGVVVWDVKTQIEPFYGAVEAILQNTLRGRTNVL